MSPVSNVQFSRFTESEVGKLFTFGGKGALEVVWPASDDERRDLEAHLKEVFGVSLATQVKARHVLVRRNRASQLWIRFDEKKERLVLLWLHGPGRDGLPGSDLPGALGSGPRAGRSTGAWRPGAVHVRGQHGSSLSGSMASLCLASRARRPTG